jgi:histone H4
MNPELPPLEAPFTPPSTPVQAEVPEVPAPPVKAPAPPVKANGPARRRVKKLKNVTKHDIRRCGRRAGIKRLTRGVYTEARSALIEFMTTIIKDATTYTAHASRKTVIKNDVMYALKKNGRTLYI